VTSKKFPGFDPRFDEVLLAKDIPQKRWAQYRKWVRFYLDFCEQYEHPPTDRGSISPFIEKLASKSQSEQHLAEAQVAVGYYIELFSPPPESKKLAPPAKLPPILQPVLAQRVPVATEETVSGAWQIVADKLKEQILLRHYSPRW